MYIILNHIEISLLLNTYIRPIKCKQCYFKLHFTKNYEFRRLKIYINNKKIFIS